MPRRAAATTEDKTAARTGFRNRIIDHITLPAEQIHFNPNNPRVHPEIQTELVSKSLSQFGWVDEIKVYRDHQGRYILVDGEDRTKIARDQDVPVAVLDLTPEEAQEVLAIYDATTLLAEYDPSRSRDLAFAIEERSRATADLLRMAADANPAQALLERLREDAESRQRALDLVGQVGGTVGDSDDDDAQGYGSGLWGDYDGMDGASGDGDSDPELSEDEGEEDTDEDEDAASTGVGVYSNDEIIDAAFAAYRAAGFPYRSLPAYVAMQRINKLARMPREKLLRTYMASEVADTYNPHRFHGHADGMKSPYEAFHDDALLRKAITLRLEGVGTVEQGYLPAMSVVTGTQANYNFRPGFAAYLYRTYCQPGDTILDTSTGYGGRLVAFMAAGIADRTTGTGRYIGIDPSTLTHAGNSRMADELGYGAHVELYNLPAEDVDPALLAERCDFAFTSPPYYRREIYSDEATQSCHRYTTPAAWRAGFLRPMLALTYAALKSGAYAALNVDDVNVRGERIPLAQWTLEDAQAVGFEYVETLNFEMASSAMGTGHDPGVAGTEPVLLFRKPGTGAGTGAERDRSRRAPIVAVPSAATVPTITESVSLLSWMERLYTLTADMAAVPDDLGVWPEELGEYLRLLCLAHADRALSYTVTPHLIAPLPNLHDMERRGDVCVLLYSGGKDSMAAGALAARQGYRVHAVYIRKVNRSYPREVDFARLSAEALGWRFTELTPEYLSSKTWGESVVKNQYCWALALSSLDYIPGAIAFGNYTLDDCHITGWYSDMEASYRAFLSAHAALYAHDHELVPERLALLRDPLDAVRAWADETLIPEAARRYTASCLIPEHNKAYHRQNNLNAGVPLLDYDCGSCQKCYLRAVLLSDRIGTNLAYPATYLKRARKRLSKILDGEMSVHAHPDLESPVVAAGTSSQVLLDEVFGGVLRCVPRQNTQPAYEPHITHVDA